MSQSINAADQGKDLAMRTIAKGAFSAIQEPVELVVTNKSQWEDLWKKHSKRAPAEPAPDVDFNKETVLFVSMGRKNSGGYSISIQSVEKAGSGWVAKVVKKSPQAGAMTIQALTAPFHIVTVPGTELKVRFETVPEASGGQKKEKKQG